MNEKECTFPMCDCEYLKQLCKENTDGLHREVEAHARYTLSQALIKIQQENSCLQSEIETLKSENETLKSKQGDLEHYEKMITENVDLKAQVDKLEKEKEEFISMFRRIADTPCTTIIQASIREIAEEALSKASQLRKELTGK